MAISSAPKPLTTQPVAPSERWVSQLPASVLIPQLFLAGGWLRAAASHTMSADWWSGQEVIDFTDAYSDLSITGYSSVLDSMIEPSSVAIASAVLVAQVLVGISLLLNWRPLAGLAVGAFLNLHFILAGAVNPSIFYLVLALGVGSWHLDQVLTPQGRTQLARRVLWTSLIFTIFLIPAVTTINPGRVVEDPAPVLIFFVLLAVIGARSLESRTPLEEEPATTIESVD